MARAMKDSGIIWLGKVPEEWVLIQFTKAISSIVDYRGKTPDKVDDGILLVTARNIKNGKIDYEISREYVKESEYDEIMHRGKLHIGDVLFTTEAPLGEVANVDRIDFALAQRIIKFSGKGGVLDNYFLKYWIFNPAFQSHLQSFATGSTALGIKAAKLGQLKLLLPSYEEQKQIVAYLDKKCAEIDALMVDVRAQIETLEQYKRSVITEAVTKGLNPNVPMKDSGVEWIGSIPTTWSMQRGKYIFQQKNDRGNAFSLVLLSPTQSYGVIPQELYEQLSGFSAVKLNENTDLDLLKTVHKGAFVISLRSFQGGFEYSRYEGVVSPAYQVFYPVMPIVDGYYRHLFKTQVFIDKMNSYTMSLRDGKNIAFADFGRTYIPVPPIEDQQSITNYLDTKCAEIDAIIDGKRQQLAVLEEYKKSIIFEYVTGKKEVPVA